MKKIFAAALLAAFVGGSPAFAIDPIPGSIIYHGQPRTKLQKAPVGSAVDHDFWGEDGYHYGETYILQQDRSLKLVERHIISLPED